MLEAQNPWHALGRVPPPLAPETERALAREMRHRIRRDDPRRYQLILGPRRVGKTTAMYQTVGHLIADGVSPNHLWWFRLDHPLLLQLSLDRLISQALEVTSGRGNACRPSVRRLRVPVIAVVRDGVAASDPRLSPLQLINTALGGSFTSRLNQNLREDHGWTYGAASAFTEASPVSMPTFSVPKSLHRSKNFSETRALIGAV